MVLLQFYIYYVYDDCWLLCANVWQQSHLFKHAWNIFIAWKSLYSVMGAQHAQESLKFNLSTDTLI